MGKQYLVFVNIIFTAASVLHAYEEWSLPNLTAPTVLSAPSLELQIQHQFWGRFNGKDMIPRFFGLGDLADVNVGLRATVWRTAQVYASYDNQQLSSFSNYEYTAGAAYAVHVPQLFVRMQADGQAFSYSSLLTYPEKRFTGYYLQGSLQNDTLLFGRGKLLVNTGYDFDKKKFGLGFGCEIRVARAIDVFGELFPIVDKADRVLYREQKLAVPVYLGGKITTPGHQFFVFLGNAQENGPRHCMRGAPDNYWRFGFMIKRLFRL
jgi:hypothetical protein